MNSEKNDMLPSVEIEEDEKALNTFKNIDKYFFLLTCLMVKKLDSDTEATNIYYAKKSQEEDGGKVIRALTREFPISSVSCELRKGVLYSDEEDVLAFGFLCHMDGGARVSKNLCVVKLGTTPLEIESLIIENLETERNFKDMIEEKTDFKSEFLVEDRQKIYEWAISRNLSGEGNLDNYAIPAIQDMFYGRKMNICDIGYILKINPAVVYCALISMNIIQGNADFDIEEAVDIPKHWE